MINVYTTIHAAIRTFFPVDIIINSIIPVSIYKVKKRVSEETLKFRTTNLLLIICSYESSDLTATIL